MKRATQQNATNPEAEPQRPLTGRWSSDSSSQPAEESLDFILFCMVADSDATLSNELRKGGPMQASPQESQEVGKMKWLLVECR